jgi:hypothetical protein
VRPHDTKIGVFKLKPVKTTIKRKNKTAHRNQGYFGYKTALA